MRISIGEAIIFIFSLLTAISSLVVGVVVILKNKKSLLGRSWFLLCLSTCLWTLGYACLIISPNQNMALFFTRNFLYLGAIFIPVCYLHFISAFLEVKKNMLLYFMYLIALVLTWVDIKTTFFIRGITPKLNFRYYPIPGFAYALFIIYFSFCVLFSFWLIFRNYRWSSSYKKNQLKYIFLASLIGFLGGATNFPLIYDIKIFPFGQPLVFLYPIIIAVAIVKHRLMDITLVITRTTIFLAVYGLVLGLPFIIFTFFRGWLITFFGKNLEIVPLLLLTTLAAVGPSIYIYLQKRAEAIIFREQLAYRRTLEQAARQLASIHNLDRLLNLIVRIVTKTVRISHSAIYLYDEATQRFVLKALRNLKGDSPEYLDSQHKLVDWLKDEKRPLVYEELKTNIQEKVDTVSQELIEAMEFLRANVIIPGFLKDRLLGFLILGNKRSGKAYNLEDLNTFSVLANEAALAIENARLYEHMEEEVKQRTEQLVLTQKQLVQAEKLATVGTLAGGVAHEINNPLTAILTNVQMLLIDEDKFDPETKESLQLIEDATKRCRNIVQKLMAYARKPLETASRERVDIYSAIENVANFLKYQLQQDNITLKISKGSDDCTVFGNQNELEQVFTNIILNARDAIKKIKKEGTVDISISKGDKRVSVSIKDNGVGIPKDIMPRIFDPFFTTKDVGKGLGLGLSICQAIIEKHKGKIAVESELNKGTVFTVELPVEANYV